MLELHAPTSDNRPIGTIRFVSTLRGRELWPDDYKKIKTPLSRQAAIHVASARTRLGLTIYSDMHNAGKDQTWVEIEKLIRMALQQSVLAFEILVGPGYGKLDRQFIIGNAFTQGLVENLDNELQKAERTWKRNKGKLAADHFSLLLMRAALSKGVAASDVKTILTDVELDGFDALKKKTFSPKTHFELFQTLSKNIRSEKIKLPKKPVGYDELSDFLIDLRFEK